MLTWRHKLEIIYDPSKLGPEFVVQPVWSSGPYQVFSNWLGWNDTVLSALIHIAISNQYRLTTTGEFAPMALRLTTLKRAVVESRRILEFRSFNHVSTISPPLNGAIDLSTASPPLVLPEFYQDLSDSSIDDKNFRFGFPSFSFGGSMELMAVPKKKV